MKTNESYKAKLFGRLLITYVAVLLLALIALFVIQSTFTQALTGKISETAMGMLKIGAATFDNELTRIEDMSRSLLDHAVMEKLSKISLPMDGKDYYVMKECSSDIERLTAYEGQLNVSVAIYLPQSGIFVSNDILTARGTALYDKYIRYRDMNWTEFCERIQKQTRYSAVWGTEPVTVNGNETNVLTFVYKTPSVYNMLTSPAVLVTVGEESLKALFDFQSITENGLYAIYDSYGNALSVSARADEKTMAMLGNMQNGIHAANIDGEAYIGICTALSGSRMRYVMLLPESEITAQTDSITQGIALALVICFLVAAVLSLLFTTVFSRPILRMAGAVNGRSTDGKKASFLYSFLEEPLYRMIDDNIGMHTQIVHQQFHIRSVVLEGLLRNHFADKDEAERRIRLSGIEFLKPCMAVALVRLNIPVLDNSLEGMSGRQQLMGDLLNRLCVVMGESAYVLPWGDSEAAVILQFEKEKEKEERFSKMNADVRECGFNVSVGVGRNCVHPFELYRSLSDAEHLLRRMQKSGETFAVAGAEDVPESHCIYTMAQEERILAMIRSGERDAVENVLSEIRVQYSSADNAAQQIADCYRVTVMRALDDMPLTEKDFSRQVNELISETPGILLPEKRLERCEQTLLMLADYSEELCRNNIEKGVRDIIGFVDEMYCDSAMCLTYIAEHFGLPEKYLSRQFKEHTGENLSAYIERKRMLKARDLLQNRDMTVGQICAAVGYSNENTFYKAFKRYFGVAPRQL